MTPEQTGQPTPKSPMEQLLEELDKRWPNKLGLQFSISDIVKRYAPIFQEDSATITELREREKMLVEALEMISRMKRHTDPAINATTLHYAIKIAAEAIAALSSYKSPVTEDVATNNNDVTT